MAKPPSAAYVPERGDIIWIDSTRRRGTNRPATARPSSSRPRPTTPRSGLLVACPMTTRPKGYPFEVLIAGGVPSAVLADQVKSLDWRARGAVFKGRASADEVLEVRKKLRALV